MKIEDEWYDLEDQQYLDDWEQPAFLNAAKQMPDKVGGAFCLTLYHTGCRPSEARLICPCHLNRRKELIKMRTLKQRGSKAVYRHVPAPRKLIDLLLSVSEDNGRIFKFGRTKGWKIVKECMGMAGISGTRASSRGLRHTFATACFKSEMPLSKTQKWMGHSRLESTLIYMNFVNEDARRFARKLWTRMRGSPVRLVVMALKRAFRNRY